MSGLLLVVSGQLQLRPAWHTLDMYAELLWSIPLENTHSKDPAGTGKYYKDKFVPVLN
jgi:hypothetical protein